MAPCRSNPITAGITALVELAAYWRIVDVDRSNLRKCAKSFEIGCDNGEKVCGAFLNRCGRRQTGNVAAIAASMLIN